MALHPGRMVEEPERQPYVRWTTCYDFEETWIIDVYSCREPWEIFKLASLAWNSFKWQSSDMLEKLCLES